jgi:hypothetical protein
MMNKRRWILSAIGVVVALLVIWIAATLFLSPAYADALPFNMKVRSRLLADYKPDDGQSLFAALRLSILGDTLKDQGLSPEEAERQREELEKALDDPVPTATALDFEGNAPFTATPTDTPTTTVTPTPTNTPTNTPRPTATQTKTLKPTKTPKPPTPTSASVDNVEPSVCCVDYIPVLESTSPGDPISTCTIVIDDVEIFDPAFSSGVPSDGVFTEYYNFDTSDSGVAALSMDSGDFASGPGSAWAGHFSGSITLPTGAIGEEFRIKIRGHDNENNWFYSSYSYFVLDVNCP